MITINALKFPVICSPSPSLAGTNYPHLEGLELADQLTNSSDSIDVLIGSDFYWQIVDGETIRGEEGPIAVNSELGWLLSGPVQDEKGSDTRTVSNLIISQESNDIFAENPTDKLVNTLKTFWETESIGVKEIVSPNDSDEVEEFVNNPKYNGTRYEVGLPWNNRQSLPSDYNLSFNRLKALQQRFTKEPELAMEYNDIIQEQLKNNIVERITDEELNQQSGGFHYLPHHAVVRKERETTKVRIVFDGSAKAHNSPLSINDCLHKGPNFIPKLFDILIRFRWNPVAVTADIEKAFLMVGVPEEDRDMIRFLWLKNPKDGDSEVEHLRFMRLVFGLKSLPAVLGAVVSHHLQLYRERYPDVVKLIEDGLYVDDLISGKETDDQAFHVYQVSKSIMATGGFNLRKWNSNSVTLMQRIHEAEAKIKETESQLNSEPESISEEDETYAKAATGACSTPTKESSTKVLGINWDCESDKLVFSVLKYASELPVSKRSLLKITAKIFDPFGISESLCHQFKDLIPKPLQG